MYYAKNQILHLSTDDNSEAFVAVRFDDFCRMEGYKGFYWDGEDWIYSIWDDQGYPEIGTKAKLNI